MPGGPYMLKALIILTLAAGALSLLLWLGAEPRRAPRRTRRAPAVSGRVVGSINAPLAMAAFSRGAGGGRGAAAPRAGEPPTGRRDGTNAAALDFRPRGGYR